MYRVIRPLLFRSDPEIIHHRVIRLLSGVGQFQVCRSLLRLCFAPRADNPVQVLGLTFPNRIGLAAGYDKDGMALPALCALGFGHVEIGTVTPLPQEGNQKPRVFRVPEEEALINRMGFPGKGSDYVSHQLKSALASLRKERGVVLGVNIGKNKQTPNSRAARDYLCLMTVFAPLADYLAINVSSPNTIGLRRLQGKTALRDLLRELALEREKIALNLGRPIPLLVKLAPDLEMGELEDALQVILETGMDGVIATNTTIDRRGLKSPLASQEGGLSGAPLRSRSVEMIRAISSITGGELPIIGVGGIDSVESAREKLDAGAVLVQLYTGLIYQGPGLVRRISSGLST